LILVAAERARDLPQSLPLAANRGPVFLLGTGESVETPTVSLTRHSRETGNPVLQYGTTKIRMQEIAVKARK
jgi:hypothetical protein